MLTKAGLSLGLLIYMQERLHSVPVGALLVSVELAAISFFEITGPIAVRWALFKVGEARHPDRRPAATSTEEAKETR